MNHAYSTDQEYYICLIGEKEKHCKSKVEQVHLTDECQRNKRYEF